MNDKYIVSRIVRSFIIYNIRMHTKHRQSGLSRSIARGKMFYRDGERSPIENTCDQICASRRPDAASGTVSVVGRRDGQTAPLTLFTIQQFKILIMIHTTLNNLNSCWP